MPLPCAIGIDIGGTMIKISLVRADGIELEHRSIPTCCTDPEQLLDATSVAATAWHEVPTIGIGIGVPALVNHRSGRIARAPSLPFMDGLCITELFEQRLRLPVVVDNDANVAALAEGRFGSAVDAELAFCLTIGTGVGGALLRCGELVRGAGGFAGEIGHLLLNTDGLRCDCGRRGCLQTEVSATAIVRDYLEISSAGPDHDLDAREVARRAEGEDTAAEEALRRCGQRLGIGLAAIINLLNPNCIVIGGGVAAAGSRFINAAIASAAEHCWRPSWEGCEVVGSTFEGNAGSIGAAVLAIDRFTQQRQ